MSKKGLEALDEAVENTVGKKSEPEKKKLSGEEKYRLLNIHLQDENFRLKKKISQLEVSLVNLRLENMDLREKAHERDTVTPFFKELGISRKDLIELREDGTLVINPKESK